MSDCPKLRPLEAFPVKDNLIGLRDPLGFSEQVLLLSPNVFFICTLFDGKHTVIDMQAEYTRRFGDLIFSDKINEIIDQLDNCLFMQNPHFEEEREKAISTFKSSPVRSATHAGSAYEADGDSLEAQLDSFFLPPDGPGTLSGGNSPNRPKPLSGQNPSGALVGLMVPHIDLRRGGNCFAWSYAALAAHCTARTFVILGIAHTETEKCFALTLKDFETPLGTVRTDTDFASRLSERCASDFFVDEYIHRREHSVEFQAVFLRYLFPERPSPGRSSPKRPSPGWSDIRIVPVLCSMPSRLMQSQSSLGDFDEVQEFTTALKDLVGESNGEVCCIAGVDLSHVGRRFGQEFVLHVAAF